MSYDPDEERDRAEAEDRARGLPWCCGQPMGWDLHRGFWRCNYRHHHRQNDAGEPVNELGRTAAESELDELKLERLYRGSSW